jgi:hypothetical protein
MRLKRLLLPAALLVAAVASATTIIAYDVPALTRASSVVVRGTVKSVAPRWTKDRARIMTDVVIEVSEPWKGTPARELTVMQPGGVMGEIGQRVHGTAKFSPGEEVVVFLEARGDRYLLTGMVQGKFKVERSTDGKSVFARQELENEALLVDPATRQPVQPAPVALPIDVLRSQVLAAAGAQAPTEPSRPGPVQVTP